MLLYCCRLQQEEDTESYLTEIPNCKDECILDCIRLIEMPAGMVEGGLNNMTTRV